MLKNNLQISEIIRKQREKHPKNNEAIFSEQHIEAKEATRSELTWILPMNHIVHCQIISLMA
jgi:hypothetical protein